MKEQRSPIGAIIFSGFIGLVTGFIFGMLTRNTGFEPFKYRLIGGAAVGGLAGMLMGNVAGQMISRDASKSVIVPTLIAGAVTGAFGAWIWREIIKIPPFTYLPIP